MLPEPVNEQALELGRPSARGLGRASRAATEDGVELLVDLRTEAAGAGRRLEDDLEEQLVEAVGAVRRHAGEALEENDAERIDVGAVVGRLRAARLLRATCTRGFRGSCPSGCCEMGSFDTSSSFEIPKSTIFAISRPDFVFAMTMLLGFMSRWNTPAAWAAASPRATCVHRSTAVTIGRRRSGPRDVRAEVLAGEELHDEIGAPVGENAGVEDLDDVRRFDVRRGERLALEPAHHLLVRGVLRLEDLDRDLPLDADVDALEHLAPRALADDADDLVLPLEEVPGRRDVLAHRRTRHCAPDPHGRSLPKVTGNARLRRSVCHPFGGCHEARSA